MSTDTTGTPVRPPSTPRPAPSGIGAPVDRVDGVAKTTGAARFSTEYPAEGMAYAALVHATVARGRITGIETGEALAVPGVLTVITHHNAPPTKAPATPRIRMMPPTAGTTVHYLGTDQVHFDGQPVAVVVAGTPEAAAEAVHLVRVGYESAPATTDFAAVEGDAPPQKKSALMPVEGTKGDAEAALAAAPFSVDLRFTTPPHHHNAIEPHATTAAWDGDRLTVHEGAQNMAGVRQHLAATFGVPVAGVRVISPFVGGGFGGKSAVWAGTVLTALAARATGRPVKLLLTREGVYRTVGGRTPSTQRVALGADKDGGITALIHTSATRTGRAGGDGEQVTASSRHLYDARNILVRQHVTEMDLLPNTYMRAPGDSIGSYALETAVDALAYETGLDPIELRTRNEPAVSPLDGKEFSHRMLREAYELGARRFGWERRTPEPRSMRDGRWLVGMGVASAYHSAWRLSAKVTVRMSADGRVVVRCGFHEMGMGGATAQAQIAADALGVPVSAVTVEYGDSELPTGVGAGGSMQTATVATSLLAACDKLKRSLLTLAGRSGGSPLGGLRPDGVLGTGGGLYAADGSGRGESYEEILARAGRPSVEAAVGSDTRWGEITGQMKMVARFLRDNRRWAKAATGAQFCEVRVDPDTGEVRISRFTGAFDVGRVINAKLAASQLRGGIVMGIGMALSEATQIDPRTGRIMNPSLSEYHVPVHADVPPIDIHWLDDPDPTMPLGLVGIGEVGITGVAAAVANAVFHATGTRVQDLPITLDKLL